MLGVIRTYGEMKKTTGLRRKSFYDFMRKKGTPFLSGVIVLNFIFCPVWTQPLPLRRQII